MEAAEGWGGRLVEAQSGGRRSGFQGCAVPPICCANRLPLAPLRGAFRVPDSRSAAHLRGDVFDQEDSKLETVNEHDDVNRTGQ